MLRRGPTWSFSDRTVRNLCIFPVLFMLIAFNVFPLLTSLYISFHDYRPAIQRSLTEAQSVGLENYRGTLDEAPEQEPWRSFSRTAGLVVVTVGAQTLLGFAAAMLLHRTFPGRGVITALLLIPMTMSPAVVAAFWKYMFHGEFGIINWLIGSQEIWNGLSSRAFWSVAIVEIWIWTPFMMLLSIAGLNAIPQSLYEAAEVDRASPWYRFRNITLPLVLPMVLLGVVFRTMDTFRIFDTAYVLNGAVEGQNTTFASVLLFLRGIKNSSGNLGSGTALAYLLLIVAVALGNVAVYYLSKMRAAEGKST